MHAEAHPHGLASLNRPFLVPVLYAVRRLQGSSAGTKNMILDYRGSTPERHHRVADELVDVAVLLGDSTSDGFEIKGGLAGQLLRGHPRGNRRKILHVGEEYRHETGLDFRDQRLSGLDQLPREVARDEHRERPQG